MIEVYKNCKLYGPYQSKDNRLRCVIVMQDGKKKTISFPKYIMEKHLGRYLEDDETIDHIDGNPLNNEISNLRVLKRNIHCYNDAIRNSDVKVKCSYCGKEFIIKGKIMHWRNRKDRNQSGYFCSKQCSGKYGADLQNHKILPIIKDFVVPNKYKVRSALDGNANVEVG